MSDIAAMLAAGLIVFAAAAGVVIAELFAIEQELKNIRAGLSAESKGEPGAASIRQIK